MTLENQSQYDPTRKTVGAIYRDAKIANSEDRIETGDMTRELTESLVDDINNCIQETCKEGIWQGRDFFITVHEAKDLAMPNMVKRRLIRTVYRPWPEDDTMVFRINASRSEVRYCWVLPHHTEMQNILQNHNLYNQEYVNDIINWTCFNMEHFGFVKVGIGDQWGMNPSWPFDKDRKMEKPRRTIDASASLSF